jgi:hypothetical protein
MRPIALLLASALLVSAAPARADEEHRRPRPARVRERVAREAAVAVRPAPPPPEYVAPAPAPRPRRYARSAIVVGSPFWWGLGFGWGYAPLYPRNPYAGEPGASYEPDPDAVHLRLSGTGVAASGGGMGGIALDVEGRSGGVNARIDALAKDGVTGVPGGDHRAIAWGSAHVTWSLVSDEVARVRLEIGGSALALPDTGFAATQPWAGRTAFGPDVGVSAQLGLVGPIGIEGHARVTPFPVPVLDTRLAVALRGGPLAVTAGWRGLHVAGDGVDAPVLDLSGPELGLSIAF